MKEVRKIEPAPPAESPTSQLFISVMSRLDLLPESVETNDLSPTPHESEETKAKKPKPEEKK